ncbi:hypothetical protein NQ156_04425 [Microbacterium sp. zg.Y625]|uniref:hypothetical protein n=1 Tax=Microbacterium jiangjiandongii TaxID=3049071 RepID=UPI00214B5D5E|nr:MULTISPECIES: hypothetical protein [unclassified Microbacterium]MCR2792304.1 hypothetical protein [Microbacterium sp. zg.Y625]WIM25100.1 hypothetical protein QNO14_13335 [Microbacterium sp. zg-Y625]
MDGLRRWALWVAVAAIVLAVFACIGAGFLISPPSLEDRILLLQQDPSAAPGELDQDDIADLSADDFGESADDPPGLAIPYLALPLGLLLIIVALMALPLIIGNRRVPLVGGIVSIVGGLAAVIGGIVMTIVAIAALLTMVSLFLAAPWGTLAYLAIFGFFDVGTSAALLGLILVLQLAAIVFLLVAQQRILGNKRLVFWLLLSLLLTLLTMLLHSIVPVILVSITDAVGAIILAVVGVVWGLLLLVGGVISLVKQLSLGRQGGGPLREREAADTTVGSVGATARAG